MLDTQNYNLIENHSNELPETDSELEIDNSDTETVDTDVSDSDNDDEHIGNNYSVPKTADPADSKLQDYTSFSDMSSGESDIESIEDTPEEHEPANITLHTQNMERNLTDQIEPQQPHIIVQEMSTSHFSPEGGSVTAPSRKLAVTSEINEVKEMSQEENGEDESNNIETPDDEDSQEESEGSNSGDSETSDDEDIITNEDIFAEITRVPLN